MLLTKTRSRKVAATTLLFILLNNLLFPVFSLALTSGPTAPEATSFEPVDTTDMVNLQTGEFAYNLPLLEIPGPEGGYPLSLSYHAGIQPNEDASWVGLGWTLNPGAISRNVNGYPDDWNAIQSNSHDYMENGTTTTYSVGVNVGIANTPVSVGAGLSFSQDTYKGFGTGFDFSLGARYQVGSLGINANITSGVGPYDDAANGYVSGGLNIGIGSSVKASLGIGFNSNGNSSSSFISGSIGMKALGVSLRSGSSKPSLRMGGLSASVSSSQEAGIQTHTTGFSYDIPVYACFSLSLGYSKMRYWIDKSTNINLYGSLYASGQGEISETINGATISDMVAYDQGYDTYSLLEDPKDKSIVDFADPTRVQGGAYPDFDNYIVAGQGLSGNMRPFLFQGEVRGQNRKLANGERSVNYFSPGVTNNQPKFRFEGDFSNSYRQTFSPYASNPALNMRSVAPTFASPIYGNSDGNTGYGGGNILAGSRHIEIGPVIKPDNPKGYARTDRYLSGMIEGFSITNESGVTYHYGLPAYSYNEENYQEKIRAGSDPVRFNRGTKSAAYAYTWYLTTITGPDFVDRDASGTDGYGKANQGDWGYWVNFEYGKWSNSYTWRNPSEGFNRDEDNEFQNCSMGRKEVYYLNAIKTRTHVAIFEKDIRNDGKGASPEVFFKKTTTKDYENAGMFNGNSNQSLRLNRIYLLKADDSLFVTPGSGNSAAFRPTATRSVDCLGGCELAANVLDKTDVDAVNRYALEDKAIRIIDFNYDYSLCQGTSNSYDINNPSVKSGKLTLKSVLFRGKGGSSLIPPTKFDYEPSQQYSESNVSFAGTGFLSTNPNLKVGDLVSSNGGQYTAVIINPPYLDPSGKYGYSLKANNFSNGNYNIITSKNPRYNNNAFDNWGMYKPDIYSVVKNQNEARVTSKASAAINDAWSLRKIVFPTGNILEVEYEPKVYRSVLNGNGSIVIDHMNFNSTSGKLYLFIGNQEDPEYDIEEKLAELYPPGTSMDFIGLFGLTKSSSPFYEIKTFDSRGNFNSITVDSYGRSSQAYVVLNGITEADFRTAIQQPTLGYIMAAGNLLFSKKSYRLGGGIRVKSINNKDNTGNKATTNYSYKNPDTNEESGVSSYDPIIFDNCIIPATVHVGTLDITLTDAQKNSFKNVLYRDMNSLLAISRELPPPGVMHEYVTITSSVTNSSESITRVLSRSELHQFEIFRTNMIYRSTKETPYTHNVITQGTIDTRNVSLKNFLQGVGNVKRITQFDKDGKKLSETTNYFLHDGLEAQSDSLFFLNYKNRLSSYVYLGNTYNLNSQGFLQERYSETKTVDEQGYTAASQVKATMSGREDYPCIPLGQTVINYVNGTQTTTQNLAFDFYSGALTKSVETNSYGDRIMTETTPAYRKYSSMGLKVTSGSNKNMLTQTAATYMYRVNTSNAKLGLISASVNTWSNTVPAIDATGTQYTQNGTNGNVWRTQYNYNWMPVNKTTDNLTPNASFVDYNWSNPTSLDPNWKKTSEITLYDVYSKGLEATDINGNYAATRMNDLSKKVELTGGASKYYEMAYSGAEDGNIDRTANGFVKKVDGTVVNISDVAGAAHTGSKSLKLGVSGKKGLVYTIECDKLTANRDYIASVWVKPVSGSVSDVKLYYQVGTGTVYTSTSSGSSTKSAGNWKLINLKISGSNFVSGSNISIGCRNDQASVEAYVDDFRFQPVNAGTIAYVYDANSGELTHILDNNNLYTRFEYDASGKLIATYREKLGLGEFKTNEYQYNFSATKYTASLTSFTASKNDCPEGYTTSAMSITIPAGRFVSYVSPSDANLQASDYAQSEANRLGTCTAPGNIQLRNNIDDNAEYYTDALLNQVEFLQSGVVKYTFTWPTGPNSRTSSSFSNVATGTYNLRFRVLAGANESARYYGFKQAPNGTPTKWTRSPSNNLYNTANTVTVSSATNYILTVASDNALAD